MALQKCASLFGLDHSSPSPSNSKFLSHLASSLVLSPEILRGGGEGDLSHPNPPPAPQCPENESWARDQERNEIPKMGATSIPEFHSLVGKNKQNRRIMPVVISHMKYNDESFAVASIGAFSTFCIALWTLYLVLGINPAPPPFPGEQSSVSYPARIPSFSVNILTNSS